MAVGRLCPRIEYGGLPLGASADGVTYGACFPGHHGFPEGANLTSAPGVADSAYFTPVASFSSVHGRRKCSFSAICRERRGPRRGDHCDIDGGTQCDATHHHVRHGYAKLPACHSHAQTFAHAHTPAASGL